MRSPIRRTLTLVTVMAILAGGAGALAPTALARVPTDTRVAGIDVDATTIPQLEWLMNRHRLSSVELTQFYLHRIAKLNPKLHAVITVSPTALAERACRRRGPTGRRPAAAPRPPDHRQGQHRHDRHADDRGLVGPRRAARRPTPSSSSSCGRPARSSSARPTCPSGRTSGPARRRVRLERGRRPDEHGLRPRPQPLRLELRLGRRRLGRPRRRGGRHRDRRLDRLPVGRQRRSSASSRPSASSAGPGSSRSRPTRTPPVRSPGTSPTRRRSSGR